MKEGIGNLWFIMKILLICITILLLLRLLVALYNSFFCPVFPHSGRLKDDPLISVLVRADNSAMRVGYILDILSFLSYPKLEIIIGIYRPDAATMQVINAKTSKDSRFRLLNIETLHKEWLASNEINYQLGLAAKGRYLVFMDPDVELRMGTLESLVSYMRNKRLGMISVLPFFRLHNIAERATWPWVDLLFLTLAPIWNDSVKSVLTATGLAARNFMLFDADVYNQFQPFDEVKKRRDWGRGIAEYLSAQGIALQPLVGDRRIILQGCLNWKRCIIRLVYYTMAFFRGSIWFASLYALVYCLWFVPFLIAGQYFWLLGTIVINLIMRAVVAHMTHTPIAENLLYSAFQVFTLPYIIWIAIMHQRHQCKRKNCRIEDCRLKN